MPDRGRGQPPAGDAPAIRRFEPEDLRPLLGLEVRAFGHEAYDTTDFEDLWRIDASFFVAEVAGRLAGYAVGWVPRHGGELISLAVDPARRRRGLGRRLALAVLEDLQRQGATTCRLQVRLSNLGAIDFYTRLGFRIVSMSRDYYTDGESAYVMRRRLTPRPQGATMAT